MWCVRRTLLRKSKMINFADIEQSKENFKPDKKGKTTAALTVGVTQQAKGLAVRDELNETEK